jgi:hypothetical protein
MSDTNSPVYTINDFCRAEHISRSLLYSLWRQGRGPRYFLAGGAAALLNRLAKSGIGS